MSLHISEKEVQKQIKKLGYKGCRNCCGKRKTKFELFIKKARKNNGR